VNVLIVGERPAGLEIHARAVGELTPEALEEAAVVAFAGDAFPDAAQEVAAGGRLLIAPRSERSCGFQAGVDHLAHSSPDELAALLHMIALHPDAFEVIAAMGRVTAHARSASP
jgi:hypothetical protein